MVRGGTFGANDLNLPTLPTLTACLPSPHRANLVIRKAMRRLALLLLGVALLAFAGCKGGICIRANAKVTPQVPPVGPVLPMAVERIDSETSLKIALVDVDGLLLNMDMSGPYSQGDNPVALFRERLMAVGRDPCVRAVVVRINSPGGGVTASDIMRHDLSEFRSRTRVADRRLPDGRGSRRRYYLATAADQIQRTRQPSPGALA